MANDTELPRSDSAISGEDAMSEEQETMFVSPAPSEEETLFVTPAPSEEDVESEEEPLFLQLQDDSSECGSYHGLYYETPSQSNWSEEAIMDSEDARSEIPDPEQDEDVNEDQDAYSDNENNEDNHINSDDHANPDNHEAHADDWDSSSNSSGSTSSSDLSSIHIPTFWEWILTESAYVESLRDSSTTYHETYPLSQIYNRPEIFYSMDVDTNSLSIAQTIFATFGQGLAVYREDLEREWKALIAVMMGRLRARTRCAFCGKGYDERMHRRGFKDESPYWKMLQPYIKIDYVENIHDWEDDPPFDLLRDAREWVLRVSALCQLVEMEYCILNLAHHPADCQEGAWQ